MRSEGSKIPVTKIWGRRPMQADWVNAEGTSGGILSIWDPA
ncbi:hypothetical protein HanXRQr2_Chr02g0070241 [Helianthus annuus]|uniref:Uncharacterized protein n=1 Tax=Helianthus annuus TaxID=4232 RepID=A0A9K3JQM1_HELAN|nr:hypothetical protein HanXRQr2_Chr02g0070241 [Helianthus annuus]KAJ0952105.1 hypothetical protein HanPSC8_Chr02g0068251 [Helianthus annuus]